MASGPPENESFRRFTSSGETALYHRLTQWVFFGPQGEIRAGWRLLMATSLFLTIRTVLRTALRIGLGVHFGRLFGPGVRVLTPTGLLFGESVPVCALFISAFVMARIENRSFTAYGLPRQGAFGKRFWQGGLLGFFALSLLIGVIGALHGFALGGWAAGVGEALRNGLIYAAAFLLVGIYEEFSFRGYLQSTLTQGIGFWPAAVVLSIAFGAIHTRNPGESRLGTVMVMVFGLFAAFCLKRTGNLWFAIGAHASWDWGETFFYSVPDSGVTAAGHLFNSSFHGPVWLTGGSAGPEGSILVFAALALQAAIVHFMFPAKRAAS